MATSSRFYTVPEAATLVGKSEIRIRQLLDEFKNSDRQIGEKVGRDWILTATDIRSLQTLPDRRTREYKKSQN